MVEYAKAVRLKINGDKSRREINTTDTYVGLYVQPTATTDETKCQ